jgi:predicted Fe-Mo cluster-binding NifX family protein
MKIAISSADGKFDSPFSDHFGRSKYFIFIDTKTRYWEAKPNPASVAQSGAGAQVVQFLADNGVKATISAQYGPTALTTLNVGDIQAFVADSGSPAELLEKFLANELERVNTAAGQAMHG